MRASGPKASSAAAVVTSFRVEAGLRLRSAIARVHHRARAQAAHLDAPPGVGEARRVDDGVDAARQAAALVRAPRPGRAARERGQERDERRTSAAARPHAASQPVRTTRRTSSASAPASSTSRPAVGIGAMHHELHACPACTRRPPRATYFTPDQREGDHGHAGLEGEEEAAALEGAHGALRAARAFREHDDAGAAADARGGALQRPCGRGRRCRGGSRCGRPA